MEDKVEKILVIGCGFSQIPTYLAAKNKGYKTIGIDGNPGAIAKHLPDDFEVVDIRNLEEVLKIAKKYSIDGVVVPGTDFPLTAAYVSNNLGLPGIDIETARICENKYLQRKKLKEGGFNIPHFIKMRTLNPNLFRYKLFIENKFNKKCIIKPVDNMAARGVIAFNPYELSNDDIINLTKSTLKFSRSGCYIIEEFVDGMEFSLDALVYEDKVFTFAFADRHFDLYPYMIEIGHTMPSIISKEIQKEINDEFIRAVKYLGINNGAAKGDIKLTKDGVFIGEIAARISGGYLSGWTTPLSCGYYPHEDLLDISLGKKPEFPILKYLGYSAERVFLSIPGIIDEVIPTKKTKCLKELRLYNNSKEEVFFPENNSLRLGSAITFSKEGRDEAIYYAQDSVKNHVIRLKANNKITENYLNSDKGYFAFLPGSKEIDWEGRDIEFALKQVRAITGIKSFLNMSENFWKYFYKGGVQGAIYYIDTHM
jgi:biotin carboxylase